MEHLHPSFDSFPSVQLPPDLSLRTTFLEYLLYNRFRATYRPCWSLWLPPSELKPQLRPRSRPWVHTSPNILGFAQRRVYRVFGEIGVKVHSSPVGVCFLVIPLFGRSLSVGFAKRCCRCSTRWRWQWQQGVKWSDRIRTEYIHWSCGRRSYQSSTIPKLRLWARPSTVWGGSGRAARCRRRGPLPPYCFR